MAPLAWTACSCRRLNRWHWPGVLIALLPMLGCALRPPTLPIPRVVTTTGVADRISIPADLNVDPSESVVQPAPQPATPSETTVPAGQALQATVFSLPEAIAFALQFNPRLRAARAAIERARGQEQVAFAPFLPQVDLLSQAGMVSATQAPGTAGATGFILVGDFGTRSYIENEVSLQWTLYDFGRRGGKYQQAVAQERIAELRLARAFQTVEFDVAATYLDVLLARASRRVQEDAVRRSQATRADTVARRQGGVALKEDVLRAEVQLSESREALILARESEWVALARLNHALGRNAGLPLEVNDLEVEPPLPGTLHQYLELAAVQRPEVVLARQAVFAAQAGWQAARGEFLPQIFVRASTGYTEGENVISGRQEGVGLHLVSPLFAGGRLRGELQSAAAEIELAVAEAQAILDSISLQVNLAYRAMVASRERISLAQTAVVQAEENLRLVRVRYRNGDATPTDIVDAEAALTRSQQRFYSATYTYLAALARFDYAVGQRQGGFSNAPAQEPQGQESATEELPHPADLSLLQ